MRYQQTGDLHLVTFSCYRRRPYSGTAEARDAFERALETMRTRYDFFVCGYVVMPEHVHLLLSEPRFVLLSKVLQALKLSVAVKREERPFWSARYYDFNVFSEAKRLEKLRYMHENPGRSRIGGGLRRTGPGRVRGTMRRVRLEGSRWSHLWTAARREREGCPTSRA